LGLKPKVAAACRTARSASADTLPEAFSTRETVATETPAARATSRTVAGLDGSVADCLGGIFRAVEGECVLRLGNVYTVSSPREDFMTSTADIELIVRAQMRLVPTAFRGGSFV
jgi:hypothetical protein